jgi:hypothetical protein
VSIGPSHQISSYGVRVRDTPRVRPKLNRGDYLRLATSRSSSFSAAYLHVGILAYLVDRPKPPLHRRSDRQSSAALALSPSSGRSGMEYTDDRQSSFVDAASRLQYYLLLGSKPRWQQVWSRVTSDNHMCVAYRRTADSLSIKGRTTVRHWAARDIYRLKYIVVKKRPYYPVSVVTH